MQDTTSQASPSELAYTNIRCCAMITERSSVKFYETTKYWCLLDSDWQELFLASYTPWKRKKNSGMNAIPQYRAPHNFTKSLQQETLCVKKICYTFHALFQYSKLFAEIAPRCLMLFGVALLFPLEFFSHTFDKVFKTNLDNA